MKKLNVLLVLDSLDIGGAEIHVISLARGLKNKGHKVIVASAEGSLTARLKEDSIKHVSIPLNKRSLFPFIAAVIKLFRVVHDEKIDIIHAHFRYSIFISFFVAKMKKIAFVSTAHNIFSGYRRLTVWGKKIIAVSNIVAQHLQNYFHVSQENIEVIYNGIQINDHPSEDEIKDALTGLNIKEDTFIIGNVGRLCEQKGQLYFLEAVPMILSVKKNCIFLLVGDGPWREKLKTEAKRLGISDKVIFMGMRNDVKAVMKNLNVLVLSSLWEGFPLTLIEALSEGVAVVATTVGGVPEIIIDRCTGILAPPKDAKTLSEAVLFLLDNPDMVRKLGENGRKFVEQRFNEDEMVGKIEKVYCDLW